MVCTLANGMVEIRSTIREDVVRELPVDSRVTAAAFAKNSLLVGTGDGRVLSFDPERLALFARSRTWIGAESTTLSST